MSGFDDDEETGYDYEDDNADEYEEDGETHMEMPAEPLDEDVYGLAIASLIKDSADIKHHGVIKLARIFSALLLWAGMFGLQVFLIYSTKKLVSPAEVKQARREYSYFEQVMYVDDAGVKHTTINANGYERGIDGFFNAKKFADLKYEDKSLVCMIPLSQQPFIFAILFIWLLTVLTQIKRTINFAIRVACLRTLSMDEDMREGLVDTDDGTEVQGLPIWMKLLIIVVILIPRIILSLFMAWLGSRWLVATMGFGDVLLNALALAFIFDLAELLYIATVPFHNKLLVRRTLMPHTSKKAPENFCALFGMFFIGILAAVLAVGYMHLPPGFGPFAQHVLPDYKWDIAEVCTAYLNEELAVK